MKEEATINQSGDSTIKRSGGDVGVTFGVVEDTI